MRRFILCVGVSLISLIVTETRLGVLVTGQTKAPSVITFVEARGNDPNLRGNYRKRLFTFSIENYQYTVNGIGQLTVKSPDQMMKKITLDFPDPPRVTSVKYCLYQGDLLINYNFLLDALLQKANGRLVRGKVEQGRIVRLDKHTLSTKWIVINAISDPPGVPIIADDSIYVTSVGIIGEIDVTTGSYLWRHEELIQESGQKLFVFKVPRVTSDYVFFEEEDIGLRRPTYTIQVKRRTGEIVTMNYKSPPIK